MGFLLLLLVLASSDATPLSILFVGNSYTYYNDLPAMLTEMCATAPLPYRYEITHASHHPGGSSLVSNSRSQELDALFKSTLFGWDYVVLQDQSQVPGGRNPAQFRETLGVLATWYMPRIRAVGAKALLYQTWGRQNGDSILGTFDEMNEKTIRGYAEYGVELGLLLGSSNVNTARVGEAFGYAHRLKEDGASTIFPDLYDPDGSHPAALGTYLAGLCFYHAITEGNSSVADITYCPPELEEKACDVLRTLVARGGTRFTCSNAATQTSVEAAAATHSIK